MSDRRAGTAFEPESPAFRVQNYAARASAAIVCYWNLTRTAGPTVTVSESPSRDNVLLYRDDKSGPY
jgi:hypothetical protein